MTTNKKRSLTAFVTLVLALVSFSLFAGDGYNPEEGWKIPPPVKKIQNPLKPTEDNLRMGEVAFEKFCASCHGSSGKGDGTKAKDLDSDPGDFTHPNFKQVSDGTLFFMINEGKDEMKAFKKKMSDKQIWQTILYMRTLE